MGYIDFNSMLGYTNNARMIHEALQNASNVIVCDNPEFTCRDFCLIFPVFPLGPDGIPNEVFNLFKTMADAAIKEKRYKTSWKYFMALYIAHHLTLYMKASSGFPSYEQALKNSLPTGIAVSKSVDGLSISYDLQGMNEDLAGYGTWKMTSYGQQLVTLTRAYGHGGMWVNG